MWVPSEEGRSRCANGCAASRHGNGRRWYTKGDRAEVHGVRFLSTFDAVTTACAIVPVNPNEATPLDAAFAHTRAHVGRANALTERNTACPTKGFNNRRCALPAAEPCHKIQHMHTARPTSPDGASLWPTFAL
eukprot:6992518-Prymnesium_polylepis.3